MICRTCKRADPDCGFGPRRRICQDCRRAQQREYNRRRYADPDYAASEATRKRDSHQPGTVGLNRTRNLRLRYGVTAERLIEMEQQQAGVCAICHQPPTNGKRLHVDHDHTTGVVRGLLCHHCNLMLGHARDDVVTLTAAITYLKEKNR